MENARLLPAKLGKLGLKCCLPIDLGDHKFVTFRAVGTYRGMIRHS